MEDPPETRDVTTEEFRFKTMRNLWVSETPVGFTQTARRNCLVASSKYGITFAAGFDRLEVFETKQLGIFDNEEDKSDVVEYFSFAVPMHSTPIHLGLNASQLTLSICSIHSNSAIVELFDVRAFTKKDKVPSPFQGIQLSSLPGGELLDFKWHPENTQLFAACLSDGSMLLVQVTSNGSNHSILHSLPPASSCSALCWSPKGKQLAIGKNDGTLTQFKLDMSVAKTVPAPPCKSVISVVDILWISSFTFVVIFDLPDPEEQPLLFIVKTSKSLPPVYINYSDVCFGTDILRRHKYYLTHIPDWNMIICSSTNAVEACVISKDSNDNWILWNLDDTARAACPIVKNEDTFPIGAVIDFTSVVEIPIGENKTLAPMPIFMMLSTEGKLSPFYMMNFTPGADSVMKKLEPLPSLESTQPPPSDQNKTDVFGKSGLGQSLTKPSAFKFSEGGQFNFSKMPSTGAGEGAVTAAFNFSAVTSAGVSDQENVSISKFNFSLTPTAPAASVSQTVSVGSAFKPPVLSSSTSNMTSSSTGTGTSLFTLHSTLADGTATISGIRPVEGPITGSNKFGSKPVAMTSSLQQPTSSTSFVQPKPQQSPSVSASQISRGSVAEQAIVTSDASTFTVSIFDEIKHFENELSELKTQVNRMDVDVPSKSKLLEFKSKTAKAEEFMVEAKQTTAEINKEITNLKSSLLETFVLVEEGNSRCMRLSDPRFLHLLKTRPLDPVSLRKMKELRKLYQYLNSGIADLDYYLDQEWDAYQSELSEKVQKLKVPTMDIIYNVVSNNHNYLVSQSKKIEELLADLERMKLHNTSSGWSDYAIPTSGNILSTEESDLSALADVLLKQKVTPAPKESKTLSPNVTQHLKEVLRRRKTTPVRSTTPANLSMSKIVSVEALRRQMYKEGSLSLNSSYDDLDVKPERTSSVSDRILSNDSLIQTPARNVLVVNNAADQANEVPRSRFVIPSAREGAYDDSSQKVGFESQPTSKNVQTGGSSLRDSFSAQSTTAESPASSVILSNVEDAQQSDDDVKERDDSVVDEEELEKIIGSGQVMKFRPEEFMDGRGKPSLPVAIETEASRTVEPSNLFKSFPVSSGDSMVPSAFSFATPSATQSSVLKSTSTFSFTPAFTFSPTVGKSVFGQRPFTTIKADSVVNPQTIAVSVLEPALTADKATTNDSIITASSLPSFAIKETIAIEKDVTSNESQVALEAIPDSVPPTGQTAESIPSLKSAFAAGDTKPLLFNAETVTSVPSIGQNPPSSTINDKLSGDLVVSTDKLEPVVQEPLSMVTLTGTILDSGQAVTSVPITTQTTMPLVQQCTTYASSVATDAPVTTKSAVSLSSFSFSLPTTTTSATNTVATDTITSSGFSLAINSSKSVFGKVEPATGTSLFGGNVFGRSGFGSPTATSTSVSAVTMPSSVFGLSSQPTTVPSVFGSVTSTSTALFTSSTKAAPPPYSGTSVFGTGTQATTSGSLLFGATTPSSGASVFGGTTNTVPARLGFSFAPSMASSSGMIPNATTTSSVFGFSSSLGSSGTSVFGSGPSGTSAFGGGSQTTVFGSTPVFGGGVQASTGAFGSGSKQVFSNASPSLVFGQTSSAFGQTTGGLSFGQSGTGFFSGLGSQPSSENANKNVFGGSQVFGQSTQATGLFGSSSSVTTVTQSQSPSGFSGFSGGGGVAQSGFGGLGVSQQSPQSSTPGGFGTAPSFGATPAFGSSPRFGQTPAFGSVSSGGFASYASGDSGTTFGSIANQGNSPTFGGMAQQPSFGQSSAFGQNPTFGQQASTAFGSPSFGGGQQTGFGSPSSGFGSPSTTASSSFTQWRT